MLVLLVLFVVAGTFDGRVGQQIPHLRTVCWMGYGTVQILLAVMGGRVHSRILLPRLPVQIVGSDVLFFSPDTWTDRGTISPRTREIAVDFVEQFHQGAGDTSAAPHHSNWHHPFHISFHHCNILFPSPASAPCPMNPTQPWTLAIHRLTSR